MNFKFSKNSIITKILIPMLLIMIVQAGIFFGTIFGGGTVSQMRDQSYEIMHERMVSRKNYIENEMMRWSNIEEGVEEINTLFRNKLNAAVTIEDIGYIGSQNSALSVDATNFLVQATEESIDKMLVLLRKSTATGIFLVFNGPSESTQKYGLYLRDNDSLSNPPDYSDIMYRVAPLSVQKQLAAKGIVGNSITDTVFNMNPQSSVFDFYYRPTDAASKHPEAKIKNFGYWSGAFNLIPQDIEILTYTLPLISDSKKIYGAIGIEISTSYFKKSIPSGEILTDNKASYIIAQGEEGKSGYNTILSSGTAYTQFFGKDTSITLGDKEIYTDTFEVTNTNYDKKLIGAKQSFKIYNSNTPFENEKWVLIGVMNEGDLLSYKSKLNTTIAIAIAVSLVFGLVAVFFVSMLITRPIHRLMKNVSSGGNTKHLDLSRTNIKEIDELVSEIEILSNNIADSSSKLSQIISLANIPIAAFERGKDSNEVFLTNDFFNLFGISCDINESTYINAYEFLEKMALVGNYLDSESNDGNVKIFKIPSQNEDEKYSYIRLTLVTSDTKTLGVAVDITQEMEEKRKLEYERDFDVLTKIMNRRAFHRNIAELFDGKTDLGVGAFIMMDLDNLKYINDHYGHDAGDAYICCTANVLRRFESENAIVARMAGDEFYAFLYGGKDKEEIRGRINEIKQGMKNAVMQLPDATQLKVRISGGVSWFPFDSADYTELINYADFAMYKVKNTVKGEFTEFDKEVYTKEAYLLHRGEDLNRIIEEELLEYHFQPIVDATNGEVFAYEALMRSTLKELSSPLEILTLARSQSKLYQIEKLTWYKALESFNNKIFTGGDMRLFINSIPNQSLSEASIMDIEAQFPELLPNVVVEFTENEQLDETLTAEKLGVFSRWKSDIALDDFGAGYSGDAVLLALMPSFVKIDMSIVRNINADLNRQQLLKNLLSYSKERHIKTIAEGVETSEEMTTLVTLGVDYLQGYYIGRPAPDPTSATAKTKKEIIKAYRNRTK